MAHASSGIRRLFLRWEDRAMKRRIHCGVIGLLLIVSLSASTPTTNQSQPLVNGPEGQRAFDDLATHYAEPSKPLDVSHSLADLNAPEPARRQQAAAYLLAILQQSEADEHNGRAEWKRMPWWGGGAESPAREIRKTIAQNLADVAQSEEAIEPALWLIRSDPLAENQNRGVAMLLRIQSPRMSNIFATFLSPPHPNAKVVEAVIEEAGKRQFRDLAAPIAALCQSYREPLREAALKQAGVLRFTPPAYEPERAFTPWLEGELRDISAMLLTEIPADAKWKRFTITEKTRHPGDPKRVREPAQGRELSGWLLGETADTYHVLTFFAEDETLAKSETTIADRTLKQDVEDFLKIRAMKDPSSPWNGMEALSRRGGLTGQFEPPFISLPEALLAAWSLARGDRTTAAAVIFPRYSEADDERDVKRAIRDMIGWQYHDELLHAFCYKRDYATAIRYAQHLSKPVFDGYRYQSRSKELAQQLTRREPEDFKTLTLPTAEQWAEQRKVMSRTEQIEFLAKRLRLLNCFQWGQPGGVSYEDTQHDRWTGFGGFDLHAGAPPSTQPVEVINPYVELKSFHLEVKDLPALVPYLGSDDYMPTYSYWRDFHPGRTLHRVRWAVTSLLNDAAACDLVQLQTYESLDDLGKRQHLENITEWIHQNANLTRDELLLVTVKRSSDAREFARAAHELIERKNVAAQPAVLDRMNQFPDRRAEIVELFYHFSPETVVLQARTWSTDNDEGVRFWAGMILLHSGDRATLEGLSIIKPVLDHDDGTTYYPSAIEELLATRREEAASLACAVLPRLRSHGFWTFDRGPIVQHLLLAGRQEAVDYISKALDNNEVTGTASGEYQGKHVERNSTEGDSAAEAIAEWRGDGYTYDSAAPDELRAQERNRLKQWVIEQVNLVREGKKSALSEKVQSLQSARWQLDAP
jgi:hypothetical protein